MGVVLVVLYYGAVCVAALLLAAFLGLTGYIRYLHWRYSHIPSPKSSSFYFGHMWDVIKVTRESNTEENPFQELVEKWNRSVNSPVYVIYFLWIPVVATTLPEDVKAITMQPKNKKPESFLRYFGYIFGERFMGRGLFSIGDYEEWQPRRRMYDPAFKTNYLKSLIPSFNECVDRLIANLKLSADGKTTVPMTEQFSSVTLDIISKVGFGSDVARKAWTDKELGLKCTKGTGKLNFLLDNTLKGFTKAMNNPLSVLYQYITPWKVETYRETTRAIRALGYDIIKERVEAMKRGEQTHSNDILAHIIGSSEHVNLEELVDDFVTFYIAGQETTANLLSFTLALILLHPEVLERLMAEIDEVLAGKDAVSAKNLDELEYTEKVLLESLRLYSPVTGVIKSAMPGGITVGGYYVPEGTQISLSTSAMAHMPEYFDDPDTFNPSRFDEKPNVFVFFPFGVGHRACIGKSFAMMEAKIVLARLLHTFHFSLPENYKLVAVLKFTQQPKDKVPCTLQLK